MNKRKANQLAIYGGITGALILIAIGAFYVFQQENPAISAPVVASPEEPSPAVSIPPAKADSARDKFPPRRTHQAWFKTANVDIPSATPDQELPKDSVYVRVSDTYRQWLLGTPVEIYIPQTDVVYKGIVDRIEPDGFGNTTIYAGPEPEDSVFQRLILTYNHKNTLAYVSTREGGFEMTASSEFGLLIPSSSLRIAKDPTIPDVGRTKRDRYKDAEYVPRRSN